MSRGKRRHEAHRARCHAVLGGQCARCGATTNLEIDHIDRATKSFNPLAPGRGWAEVLVELRKCQLLCAPHHREKTTAENFMGEGMPHGLSRYVNRKCRCPVCRAASAQYARDRRVRARAASI